MQASTYRDFHWKTQSIGFLMRKVEKLAFSNDFFQFCKIQMATIFLLLHFTTIAILFLTIWSNFFCTQKFSPFFLLLLKQVKLCFPLAITFLVYSLSLLLNLFFTSNEMKLFSFLFEDKQLFLSFFLFWFIFYILFGLSNFLRFLLLPFTSWGCILLLFALSWT